MSVQEEKDNVNFRPFVLNLVNLQVLSFRPKSCEPKLDITSKFRARLQAERDMAFVAVEDQLPVFGHDLDGGCGVFVNDANEAAVDELDLGDDGFFLAGLPLHEEMGQTSAGVTTGDLLEACNLHLYSHKRSAGEEEVVAADAGVWSPAPAFPAAKRQRQDEGEVMWLLPEGDTPLPAATPEYVEEAAGEATDDYVAAAWVAGVVHSVGQVTPEAEAEWKRYLVEQYGATSGSSKPRTGAVRKIILTDRMLLALSQARCQDARLVADKGRALVEADILPGEEEGLTRFLRPGRNFTVHDPLGFNKAFRALQASHPSWPRLRGIPSETKGITQPLSALGLGPVDSAPWDVRTRHLRGPEDTDPDKAWCAASRKWVTQKGKRDGLYHRRYVFDEKRVATRALAAHVFATLPSAPPKPIKS